MKVRFTNSDLGRLETDKTFTGGLSSDLVKLFRRRIQYIRDAMDERDFYALKSLHYEKLKGHRSHQRSMRLNDQFRLIMEVVQEASDSSMVVVVGIEDYH